MKFNAHTYTQTRLLRSMKISLKRKETRFDHLLDSHFSLVDLYKPNLLGCPFILVIMKRMSDSDKSAGDLKMKIGTAFCGHHHQAQVMTWRKKNLFSLLPSRKIMIIFRLKFQTARKWTIWRKGADFVTNNNLYLFWSLLWTSAKLLWSSISMDCHKTDIMSLFERCLVAKQIYFLSPVPSAKCLSVSASCFVWKSSECVRRKAVDVYFHIFLGN